MPFAYHSNLLLGTLTLSLFVQGSALSDDRTFVVHVVNKESIFSACAAIDVNRDGRLDIVSGGYWYEAPTWTKHFLRDVEQIRGRYDDYSNLPLDVNADGWTDLVSVNYRSQSLYWVEHPGEKIKTNPEAAWVKHVIDTPGPMETGRLADVDGDGKLDVLPNGTTFAAWWELIQEKGETVQTRPRWIKHELPQEIAGHGIGQGDINGDGRLDLVGPKGWLEAPEDRRKGRWIWHPEFELPRDASIPLLVFDVDADGDADIVYGRGHNIGLYWLEQQDDMNGPRRWERHAIDTSWSQPHSLLLADLDGDKVLEVISGKRYLGHDGRDPGEYDPLTAYSYQFDKTTRTWRRATIQEGAAVGFALDPKAVDLDGDGDLDLIASDVCGLYWLENRPAPAKTAAPPAPKYANHSKLLSLVDGAPLKTPFDWGLRRSHIQLGMKEAMGQLPESSRRVPLSVKVLEETQMPKYLRRKLTFQAESGDRVPAYLLIPRALGQNGKAKAMLCLHQTTGIGKGEPAGLGGQPSLHYAHELAERGFICLVPDYPSFGDYKFDFKTQGKDYASGSMKAIWNNLRAVDLLEAMPEVETDKIGVIGHSLGGHNALFTAAFDQRLRAVVTSCGFTAFHHYYGGKLAGWTSDRYMPRIRESYGNDPNRMPFDFYGVLGAIAPRPIFVCAPQRDDNFDLAGVKKVVAEVDKVYEFLGSKVRVRAEYPDSAHDFPDAERRAAYEWLESVLK